MKPLRFRTLLARLYAVSLLQLIAIGIIATTLFLVNECYHQSIRERAFDAEDELAVLARQTGDRAALAAAVRSIAERQSVDLSIYDAERALVATSVTPALPLRLRSGPRGAAEPPMSAPPPPHAHHGLLLLGLDPPHEHVRPLRLVETEGFLVVRPATESGRALPTLLASLAGILVVLLGWWLMARSVIRPLSEFSAAARRLGAGALGTRLRSERTDELGDVARAFDDMAERIERLVRAEKELLANVSHELRTPLARIRVAVDLATDGDAAASRAALSEISVDLKELEALLGDVLTTSRLAAEDGNTKPAELAPRLRPTKAAEIAEKSATRFRSHHPERRFELELQVGDAELDADPVLLRRALDNVLDNAAKYSKREGASVKLAMHAEPDAIHVLVDDDGVGVDGADLPHVFEPFFRADRSRTRDTGGSGLGLALAKGIVEAHGGTIVMRSRAGDGTSVEIRLPRRRGEGA